MHIAVNGKDENVILIMDFVEEGLWKTVYAAMLWRKH